jgi:hypothetical protein
MIRISPICDCWTSRTRTEDSSAALAIMHVKYVLQSCRCNFLIYDLLVGRCRSSDEITLHQCDAGPCSIRPTRLHERGVAGYKTGV